MEQKADDIFEDFVNKRKVAEAKQADAQDLEELKALESKIKNKKN